MLAEFSDIGYSVILSNSTHHVIVFYQKTINGGRELLTPETFAELLTDDSRIFDILKKHVNPDNSIDLWKNSFIEQFGRK